MKINAFHSPRQTAHNPAFEIYEHGRQVGYYESPQRLETILKGLAESPQICLKNCPPAIADHLHCHDKGYLGFLQQAFTLWQSESPRDAAEYKAIYPTAHPADDMNGNPAGLNAKMGTYIKDLSAPITQGTWEAALASAGCAVAGAADLELGARASLALCRPPGHHAGVANAAGYCYINNAAVAATLLAPTGKVAILDIDYHAGNGTQQIFYANPQVPVCSIHADPHNEYPYYAGFAHETGTGDGQGAHRNIPLPAGTQPAAYMVALEKALAWLSQFTPRYLVLSAGFDTFKQDPLGSFQLETATYTQIGAKIRALGIPTLVVLEGGYDIPRLPANLLALIEGLLPGQL